jgi:nitroreductase
MRNSGDKALMYSYAHTGFISQNVYLFCASAGLGTVVRDMINRDVLRKTMKLNDNQYLILSQSVGYPK